MKRQKSQVKPEKHLFFLQKILTDRPSSCIISLHQINFKNAEPLYQWLKERKKGVFGKDIKWNFTKFLIDREGNVVARYSPTTKPEKIEESIRKLL